MQSPKMEALYLQWDGPANVEVSCADLRVVLEARGEPVQLKQKQIFKHREKGRDKKAIPAKPCSDLNLFGSLFVSLFCEPFPPP